MEIAGITTSGKASTSERQLIQTLEAQVKHLQKETASLTRQVGGEAHTYQADVEDPSQIRTLMKVIIQTQW